MILSYIRRTRCVLHYIVLYSDKGVIWTSLWGPFYVACRFTLPTVLPYTYLPTGLWRYVALYRRFQKRKPLKRGVRQFLKRSTRVSKGLLMFKDECVPTCKSASLYKSVVNWNVIEDARLLAFTGTRDAMVATGRLYLSAVRRHRCWRFPDSAAYVTITTYV